MVGHSSRLFKDKDRNSNTNSPASKAGNDSRALGAAPRVGAGAQLEVSAAAEMVNIVQANHIVKITAALLENHELCCLLNGAGYIIPLT